MSRPLLFTHATCLSTRAHFGMSYLHPVSHLLNLPPGLRICRVQVLAGFANAVVLVFVALNICLEATVHLMEGGHDVTTHRLLPVSVAGLAVNLLGLVFAHKAHQHGAGACWHTRAVSCSFESSMDIEQS